MVGGAGMGDAGSVICKGHEARVVHVACISREDEVIMPMIGTADSQEWMGRASVGMVAAVGAVRWEGCS
jgi:hypothetical protein